MQCAVYKGRKKQDTYLFVEQADDFSRVPESLIAMLGELEFVMELSLEFDRQLARTDTQSLKSAILNQGFYLQPPPGDTLQMVKKSGF